MKIPEQWSDQGSYSPRQGNTLNLYIDGQESFAAIADSIASATSSVYATFAYVDLGFRLKPQENTMTILDLLLARAQAGVDVRILIWNPVLVNPIGTIPDPPTKSIAGLNDGPRTVQARWDSANTIGPLYSAPFGCHHQKTFVIDRKIAFVGGINSVQNYWDTPEHQIKEEHRVPYSITRPLQDSTYPNYPPLHDLFARITGPCVQDVEANFVQRWNGASFPHAEQTKPLTLSPSTVVTEGPLSLQITRTIAPKKYADLPQGESSILDSYLKAISAAQKLIYFENQYYYNDAIDEALEHALARGVRIIGLLARRPDQGQLQGIWESTREWYVHLGLMAHRWISRCGVELYYPSIAQPDLTSPGHFLFEDIYVHAKVLIVDDMFLTLGSANISSYSMDFHSEMNVVCNDPATALTLRTRLWQEHLQTDLPTDIFTDPEKAYSYWRADAQANVQAFKQKKQPHSRIFPWDFQFRL